MVDVNRRDSHHSACIIASQAYFVPYVSQAKLTKLSQAKLTKSTLFLTYRKPSLLSPLCKEQSGLSKRGLKRKEQSRLSKLGLIRKEQSGLKKLGLR